MCFAFSSWTDSLASAMTTLGAKPNHAFFNCQHPSRKKSKRCPSNAPRSGREIRRTRLSGGCARSQPASARQKRNIVFKVVLSASHSARRGCGPLRAPLAATRRRQRPKDKRIDPEIFPGRLFSRRTSRIARICANSKSRYAPSATHRVRTGTASTTSARTRSYASKQRSIRARRASLDALKTRFEPKFRSAAHDAPRTARIKKSRPRSRDGFGSRCWRAHDAGTRRR